MTSRGSFRVQFALHRASEILARGKDIATALTIAGSRFAPLTAAGVTMHALLIAIGACTRSFDELARAWRPVQMSQSLSGLADEALRLTRVAEIDARLAGEPLALVGNYLNGLSIGDCAERAVTETDRLLAQGV